MLNHKNYYFFDHRLFWPQTVRTGIHEVSVGLMLRRYIRQSSG